MTKRTSTLAIIVLNWNGASDAIKCINSLLRQTVVPKVVLVDNNSTDDSVLKFKKHFKNNSGVTIIQNSKNLGFAGGINTGIKWATSNGYEYIGVLNPDATAAPEWCEVLLNELKKYPKTGIATGLLLREDGKTVDSSGDLYTTWGLPGPRNRDEATNKAPKKPGYVFGATGGGAIYRANMFNHIAVFDEAFFMYYEDVDLSFRAQLAGYKVRYNPAAIAYHKQGASTKKVPGLAIYNTFKNLPMVFIKNVPGSLFITIGIKFFFTYWLILLSAIRHGNGWPAFQGFLVSISLWPHSFIRRYHIQASRKVTVEYIKGIIHKGPLPNQTGLLKFRSLFIKK